MAEVEPIPEWWNMDITLADIISTKLQLFAENNHGHPGNYTQQAWDEKLHSIIVRLERYVTKFDYDQPVQLEIEQAGQDAMRDLADIFFYLWD